MHTIVPSNPPQTGGGMELASLPPPAAAAAPWRRRRRIENTLFIASYHTSLRSICCLLFQVCTTYIGSNRWVSIHSSIEHSLWVSTVWVAATKARNNGIRGERQLWERIWERGVFFVSLFSFCRFWWFWCEAIGRTDARWENYSLTRFVVQYVVVVFYFFAGEPKIPPKQHTYDFVVSLCFYSLVLASLFFSWICAAWSGENSSSRSDGGGSVKWWKKNEWGMDGGAGGGGEFGAGCCRWINTGTSCRRLVQKRNARAPCAVAQPHLAQPPVAGRSVRSSTQDLYKHFFVASPSSLGHIHIPTLSCLLSYQLLLLLLLFVEKE